MAYKSARTLCFLVAPADHRSVSNLTERNEIISGPGPPIGLTAPADLQRRFGKDVLTAQARTKLTLRGCVQETSLNTPRQQTSVNPSVPKLPVNAIPDFILRGPASGIVALAGIDSDRLRLLLNQTEVAGEERRALFLSLNGIKNAERVATISVLWGCCLASCNRIWRCHPCDIYLYG
jgi:hypothetical protein